MNVLNTTQNREETKVKCYVCTAVPFLLGKVVYTQGVQLLLDRHVGVNLSIYLERHQNGDWGDICIEDKITNDEATKTGERVISSYTICDQSVWVITERDRSVTTILLPCEY
ncbi:type I restriction endonuclease subunit M [Vibrio chagasii]|uniref:Type I restriction endonuclease subunit M n=1 Tax=Vibrio chagasii TaxID=170679 RepID=A0A7Y3YUK0_9VIBR|nr:type I restriction endonuclease subunit M [Vibrio chagasii]NOH36590.1 type I restriction endonuclease subunit M [Vibrio chagasii]